MTKQKKHKEDLKEKEEVKSLTWLDEVTEEAMIKEKEEGLC